MKCPDCRFEMCHEAQEVTCCRYCVFPCGSGCKKLPNVDETIQWLEYALAAPLNTSIKAYETTIIDAIALLKHFKETKGDEEGTSDSEAIYESISTD